MVNYKEILKKIWNWNKTISAQSLQTPPKEMSDRDIQLLKAVGVTYNQLLESVNDSTAINYERSSIYRELERAQSHWMMSCLTGSTCIRLCNGQSIPISAISNNISEYIGKSVWSINPETLNLEPDKIVWASKTRPNAEIIRVHLDNGKYIDCTPDHRFMLRNGEFEEAQNLKEGQSLMPFYSRTNEGKVVTGYESVYNPKDKQWHFAHRLVGKLKYPGLLMKKGIVIHHKDFNKLNNDPDNLQKMTYEEHASLHFNIVAKQHKEDCQCCRCCQKRGEKKYGWKKGKPSWNKGKKTNIIPWNKGLSKETSEKVAVAMKKVSEKRKGVPLSEKNKRGISLGLKGHKVTQATKKKISNTLKGHGVSEETRKNQSIAQKKRFERERAERIYLNHKVIKIEWLDYKEDTYDITTEKNHNFSLDAGIIVHNSATDLFADFATPLSPNNNRTIWPYSKDTKYMRVLEKFLDEQEVEEKIFDWAWTTGGFGDLIVEVNGQPGLGIININDSLHPSAISRIDYDGTLLGFYQTPFDTGNMSMSAAAQNETELLPPWKYVHFRLLGSVKRRPSYADPTYQEHRTIYLMGAETKQVSTKYGTSLLFNGLPVYKRLRMAEDALLLARLTRGIMKYIYKIRVDSSSPESAGQIVQEYMNILKHARAINTSDDNPGFENKSNPMCLTGDTKLRLCNGKTVTIKEAINNKPNFIGKHIWSINPETLKIEPTRILDIFDTRKNAQLVRVHLDNEKYVDCTPDHRFMLRDGSYEEAQNLKEGQSLMPFYSKISEHDMKGYELVYSPGTKKYGYAHRVTFNPKQMKGHVIHHKDFNKLNNDPDNLVRMGSKEHSLYHLSLATPELVEKRRKGLLKHYETSPKTIAGQSCAGKTLDQIYGQERATEIKETISKNQVAWMKGKTKENDPKVASLIEKGVETKKALYRTEEYKEILKQLGEERKRKIASGEIKVVRGKEHPHYGKKWEDIYTKASIDARLEKIISSNKERIIVKAYVTKFCGCGCGEQFKVDSRYPKSFSWGHHRRALPKTKSFKTNCLVCDKEFSYYAYQTPKPKYCSQKCFGIDKTRKYLESKQNEVYLNHKVVRVEWLAWRQDTYDITVQKNHNFSLDAGIFVHNSSVEDLFVPVFGETGDVAIEKVGGEPDIKWICLRGNTEVCLLDGRKVPIKEMADNRDEYIGKYVYSCSNDGEIVPRKIKDARITKKNSSFVRVHLDNGEYFDVTPDHRCMLRDGSFLEAEKLSVGQSLMPLYTEKADEVGSPCYEKVYNPRTNGWRNTHRLVASSVLKDEQIDAHQKYIVENNERYLVVHHKNFNMYDNDPSNLIWMGDISHHDYHTECRWAGKSEEERRSWVMENVISKRGPVQHKQDCGCLLCLAKQGEYKTFNIIKNITCKHCGLELGEISSAQYANHVQWNCSGHKRTTRRPVSEETRKKQSQIAKNRIWIYSELMGEEKLINTSELSDYESKGWLAGRLHFSEDAKARMGKHMKGRIRIYSDDLQKEKFVREEELARFLDSGWMKGTLKPSIKLNHKVIKVEYLDIIEDAYDLTIDGDEHTFAVSAGIFVHNCDIEELRNQLACSLRVPLSLLGGYVQEASGSLGSEAISKLDIRFARSAKRLQRALTNGTKRLCQIHLAYLGMDPDPRLFDIQMGETNTEEEETIKKNIDTSTDTITKFMEMLDGLGLNLDKKEILNYFNKKLLKLNDFDLEKYIKQELPDMTGQLPEQPEPGANKEEESVTISDTIKREFYSYLPLNETSTSILSTMNESEWKKKYAGQSVQIREVKG